MNPRAPRTGFPDPRSRGVRVRHRRRRRAARLAATAALLLLAGSALYSPAAAPAAHHPRTAASAAVLDGNARFEVLTPTLIRMEYAGDGRFEDAETFNAVNRSFPAVPFTTSVDGAYRVIDTGSVTLRYKEGSGPFTAANTSITISGTNATAAPSFPSYCVFGTACEAEDGLLSWGAMTAYDHGNHTGSGFVAGFGQVQSAVQQDVSAVPSAGTYQLSVRYANATRGQGQKRAPTPATTGNRAA